MGLAISFRGKIRNLRHIETFEDRIVELALEINGFARVWRSAPKNNVERVVRGVMLDLAPGLETVSLLLSPEGALVPLGLVSDAESGPVAEDQWVSVQTQFGALEAHVMLLELLDAMSKTFFPSLEMKDEGQYLKTRDLESLHLRMLSTEATLASLAKRLERSPVTPTKPDFKTIQKQITDASARVLRILKRPPEHPPVIFKDDGSDDYQRHGTEAEWDAFYKENERKQHGLTRAFEEQSLKHDNPRASFEEALRSEGIVDLPQVDDKEGESRPDFEWEIDDDKLDDEAELKDDPDVRSQREDRHPLLKRVSKLTMKILKLPRHDQQVPGGFLDPLVRGILEMSGGMAQVYSGQDNDTPFGLKLVQLKRVLRGASFARASIFPVLHSGILSKTDCRHILDEVTAIEEVIQKELHKTRRKLQKKNN